MSYPAPSTSTPSTIPVSSGCPKPQATTSCPIHGDLPLRDQTRSNARTRSSSLMNGLVGRASTVILAASNYKRSKSTHTPELDITVDMKRVAKLASSLPLLSGGKIHQAYNEKHTKARLHNIIAQARSFSAPELVYIGGHANQSADGREFEYIFGDCVEGEQIDPSHKITSTELRNLLLSRQNSTSRNMVLLTDFCNSFNFLYLPWALYWDGENYFWKKSGEPVSDTWKSDHKVLHFAGGQKGAITYSFPSTGSLFCREFFNAEDPDSGRRVSLSERMRAIREGVRTFCDAYNLNNNPKIRQEPQLYASHPFDLHHPASLDELLRSPELLDCCRGLDL